MAHEEKLSKCHSKTSCLRLQNNTAKPEKKGKLIWNIFVLQNGSKVSVSETHPALNFFAESLKLLWFKYLKMIGYSIFSIIVCSVFLLSQSRYNHKNLFHLQIVLSNILKMCVIFCSTSSKTFSQQNWKKKKFSNTPSSSIVVQVTPLCLSQSSQQILIGPLEHK